MATPATTARKSVRYDFEIHSSAHAAIPVLKAGSEAFGFFVRCALASKGDATPGYVTHGSARAMARDGLAELAALLVGADLWRPDGGGWRMVPKPREFRTAEALWRFHPVYRREPIPDTLRNAVYARDNHACVRCGATNDLTLDHIHPWSLGGPDSFTNLQTLCRPCNSRKGAQV